MEKDIEEISSDDLQYLLFCICNRNCVYIIQFNSEEEEGKKQTYLIPPFKPTRPANPRQINTNPRQTKPDEPSTETNKKITMCLLSPNSKQKLKATFTTPRSATGFVVRSTSPPLPRRETQQSSQPLYPNHLNYANQAGYTNQANQVGYTNQTNQINQTQYRTRRPSAWTDPERGVREWKADIERLERDARVASDERTESSKRRGTEGSAGREGDGGDGSTLGGNADSVVLS